QPANSDTPARKKLPKGGLLITSAIGWVPEKYQLTSKPKKSRGCSRMRCATQRYNGSSMWNGLQMKGKSRNIVAAIKIATSRRGLGAFSSRDTCDVCVSDFTAVSGRRRIGVDLAARWTARALPPRWQMGNS